MKYRFEETLTWIIPGFYFLLYTLILVCNLFSSSIELPQDKSTMGVYISILVFTIPMLSLMVGWLFDGYAGYLFRHIIKKPIQKGYESVFHRDVSKEEAEREFDAARDRIELNNVDRFYYRYIFSRNMFTTQIVLVILTFCMLICSKSACDCSYLIYLAIGIAIWLLFIPIVYRDLTTHVKYVFLEDTHSQNASGSQGQNPNPQQAANQP